MPYDRETIVLQPIAEFCEELSACETRTYNVCRNAGVETVGDLLRLGPTGFLKQKRAGRKSLIAITERLRSYGIEFVDHVRLTTKGGA